MSLGERPARLALLAVIGVHLVGRIGYHLAGVRFQWRHAFIYHHFIDAKALESSLWSSLWYDHAQPPGLNLLWGSALKIFPSHPNWVLIPVFMAMGLAITVSVFVLALRLGLKPRGAAVLAGLWALSPTAVLTENYFMYTPLEVLGLLAMAILLGRWCRTGSTGDALGLAICTTVLALTRASFHPVWVVGVMGLLWWTRRDRRNLVAAVALIPLVFVGGWVTKNQVLFDQAGTTSWTGANLSRITTEQLSPEEIKHLQAEGHLSLYASYRAFSSFEEMGLAPTRRSGPGAGQAVLDQYVRGNYPGFANLHQRDYLDVNAARMKDSLWVLEHRPGAYARGVSRSLSLTFRAAPDWFGYETNVAKIGPLVAAERLAYGGVGDAAVPGDPHLGDWTLKNHEWLLMALYGLVLVAVPVRLTKRGSWTLADPTEAVVAFLWLNTVFFLGLGILVEFGENNRFRSVLDPLVWLLTVWLVTSRRPLVTATPVTAKAKGTLA